MKDLVADCALLKAATRDLNLIWRRGSGNGQMQRAEPGAMFTAACALRALFVADAATLIIDGAEPLRLEPSALACAAITGQERWQISSNASPPHAWWIGFSTFGTASV